MVLLLSYCDRTKSGAASAAQLAQCCGSAYHRTTCKPVKCELQTGWSVPSDNARSCPLPQGAPTAGYGAHCANGCINNNIGYATLLEAWDRCAELQSSEVMCSHVMAYANGLFYLRGPKDAFGGDLQGYKYCRDSPYLAGAKGTNVCPSGSVPVSEASCEAANAALMPPGKHAGRTLVAGSWGQLPPGCSTQAGGDWAAHFNRGHGNNDGGYTRLCAVSQACKLVPSLKKFDGECSGSETKVYEGNGDNPGSAAQQQARCAQACDKYQPNGAQGFVIYPSNGRCFCEYQSSASCGKVSNGYDRYDIEADCSDNYAPVGGGSWGGECECPSGEKYWVSDRGDLCGSINCIGGRVSTPCKSGAMADTSAHGKGVTCGPGLFEPTPVGFLVVDVGFSPATCELCPKGSFNAQGSCSWMAHANKYSGAYAGGVSTVYSLVVAKKECENMGSICQGVTCKAGGTSVCTLRASPDLGDSPSGETTHTLVCVQAKCTPKATCPTDNQYTYFPPISDDAVLDHDDTWCRPKCSAGELYSPDGTLRPNLGRDSCVRCPRNSYMTTAYPHTDEVCTQCLAGKFTAGAGAKSDAQCKLPQVIPYRSTHRIWYFFGPELKLNTDCMQTWIGQRGLAENKGVAAIRDSGNSPICLASTADFAQEYINDKRMEDFTWNKYPLDIRPSAGGDFLLLSALPGQTVDATFTSYQGAQTIELLNIKGGALDEETLCGCVDYTLLLPSTCNITMILTVDHRWPATQGPLEIGDFAKAPASLSHSFWQRAGSLNQSGYSSDNTYVAPAAFASFACAEGVLPDPTAKVTTSSDPAVVEYGATSDSDCAASCASKLNRDCVAYTFVATTSVCSLYYPENWDAPSSAVVSASRSNESWYCAKDARTKSANNKAARYHLSSTFGEVTLVKAPPVQPSTLSKALLRGCTTAQLECTQCSEQDIKRNLNTDLASMTGLLLRSGNATAQLGCATSTEMDPLADCLPPDHHVLRDVDAGFYFRTDETGSPGTFAGRQHRGKSLFDWTDYSFCEQAFTLSRRWKAEEPDAWSDEGAFTSGDVTVHGGNACGEHITAADHFDDLLNSEGVATSEEGQGKKRQLGMYHEYCVAALSVAGKGGVTATSNKVCTQMRVFWESTVVGRVQAKGTDLPVEGVTLDWAIAGRCRKTPRPLYATKMWGTFVFACLRAPCPGPSST